MEKLKYEVKPKYPYAIPEKNIHPKGCGVAGCYLCEQSHYLADPHCPCCGGAGLVYPRLGNGKTDGTRFVECKCLTKTRDEVIFDKRTGLNRSKTFKTFLQEISGTEKAFQFSKQLADGTAKYLFLTICGKFGSGKTHLAYAIGNLLFHRNFQVQMYPVQDLLSKMRMAMKDDSLEFLVKRTKEIECLILDDYRVEYHSDWATSRLEEIINYRYEVPLLTVVTTNNDMEQLPGAIASRLCDKNIGCVVVNSAEDFRITAKVCTTKVYKENNTLADYTSEK
jgi:hypothetical protein